MKTRTELTAIANSAAIAYAKTRKTRKDLCGLCMITASALHRAMVHNDEVYGTNYSPRLIMGRYNGSCHCWVESEGVVYDPTYSQFSERKIHIGKRTIWHITFKKTLVGKNSFMLVENRQKPTERKLKNFLKRMESV